MSSGLIDIIVAESDDGGNERQKVDMNNAGVMGSWPDTKIGYHRLQESDDSSLDEKSSHSDETENISVVKNAADMTMASWPADTKIGYHHLQQESDDISEIDHGSVIDNVDEFSPPEIDEAGVSSNRSASASNLSFYEMGYTRGWGHGKVIWPQQSQFF